MTKFKKALSFLLTLSLLAAQIQASAATATDAENGVMVVAPDGASAVMTLETGSASAETAKRSGSAADDSAFYGYLLERGRGAASDTQSVSRDGDTAQYVDTVSVANAERYASVTAGRHLQGFDRTLYDLLKADIVKVAAGNLESTIFRFTAADMGLKGKSWTAAELGVSIQKTASGQLTDATWEAVWGPLYRAIGHDRDKSSSSIMDKLLVDCPYELYWFAKSHEGEDSGAAHWTYHWSVRYNESKGFTFSDDAYLDVEMMVAENYAKSADSENYYNYRVDTSLAKQAASIAANAKKIVDANKSGSDFQRLTAYRDAICDAVSYDHDAANLGSEAYGNGPWQLIRVFDGDPSTNVVCEGYAKAFQYLCDLTEFSSDVASYIITGNLIDRSGKPGPHMWNHVRLNGRYWLVDLTNCDVENVSRDWLFFKAPYAQTGQGASRSYSFARNGQVALRYANLENAYDAEEVLILTEVDYSSLARESDATAAPETPSNAGTQAPPDNGATETPSNAGTQPPSGNGGETDTPSNNGETQPPSGNGGETDTPSNAGTGTPSGNGTQTPSNNGDGGATSPENADWSVTYPVRVTNGFSDFTEAPAGLAIKVTANPAPMGQRFLSWGGALGLTFLSGSASSETAVFVMPSEGLYLSAVYESASFDDVEQGSYYEQPVSWAVSEGITNGTSPRTFSPHETCTRAQILTFLYRAAGEPPVSISNPFTDVAPNVYYYRPALWAAENGLVEAPDFEPNMPCTRAAVMTYLWKLAGSPTGAANPFEDLPDWTDYADAVAWAVSRGVTTGTTPTTFEPERTCTRAQIVTFLYRYLVETGATLTAPAREVTEESGGASPEAVTPDSGDSVTPDNGATADSGDSESPWEAAAP